jgi:hypothetical protein
VFATSPTLVTPALGTPVSGVATNLTGTASGLTAGNVTTNANLTGEVTSVGNAATLTNSAVIAKVLTGYASGAGTVAATDSILQAIQKLNGNDATNANLTGPITSVGNATSIASQTGTGTTFVMNTSPTLVTPNIGVATGTSFQGIVGDVTPAAGTFTTLTSTGNATLGDAEATDTHAIKGATTLLANSASAALTVTQTGAGNAFVVEDSASTDATPFAISGSGSVAIGATPSDSFAFNNARVPTATTSWGAYSNPEISATVTTFNGFESRPSTIASAFTLGTLSHYVARQGTIGATSAVTDQFGFNVNSGLTGATNNYGFYSNIASAANSYNFYAAGTAPNRFVGETTVSGPALLGYSTGAGGTVTQATSKSTGVTLNKPCGVITTAADALGAGVTVVFNLANSLISAGDVLSFNTNVVGGENYNVWAANTYAGNCAICIKNVSGGSLSQSLLINFSIIKGATA